MLMIAASRLARLVSADALSDFAALSSAPKARTRLLGCHVFQIKLMGLGRSFELAHLMLVQFDCQSLCHDAPLRQLSLELVYKKPGSSRFFCA
jgi:hypothetical protein